MKILSPPSFPFGCIHHHSPITSFHAVVKIWKDRNYCEVVQSRNPFFWAKAVGDILLYNWDTLEHLNPHQQYTVGLFANTAAPLNGKDNRRWIYWPRQSHIVELYYKLKPLTFTQRQHGCMFIGGYENLVQRGHRFFHYWKPALDFCDIGIRGGTYNWHEYTRLIRQAKFGLCLRGVGPKCHREIECMAMGTVPIVTPGVDMDGYCDAPKLGQHYLFARGVEDVIELVRSTPANQWREMSWQCRDWYWRNCSPIGAFETTKRIIDSLQERPTVAA